MESRSPGTETSVVVPLATGAALVAPFMALQWVNRRALDEDFPFVLFAFMALNALFIGLALTPSLRRLRMTKSLRALPLGHWAGLVLAVFLGYVYVNVVLDQLPCFLGVPNCD